MKITKNSPILNLIGILTIIFLVSCGPTEEQRQEIYNEGYIAGQAAGYQSGKAEGYELGKTAGIKLGKKQGYKIGYDTGFANARKKGYQDGLKSGEKQGYQDGLADGITIGEDKGKVTGYEKGRQHKFKDIVLGTMSVSIPEAVGLTLIFFLVVVGYTLLHRYYLVKMKEKIQKWITLIRWRVTENFSNNKKVQIAKERWQATTEEIQAKEIVFKKEIDSCTRHIKRYSDYVTKGMPEAQINLAHMWISENKVRMTICRRGIAEGQRLSRKIEDIQIGLDCISYRIRNESVLDVDDLITQLESIKENVEDYLNYELEDLYPTKDEFKEFSDLDEDDFLNIKSEFSIN